MSYLFRLICSVFLLCFFFVSSHVSLASPPLPEKKITQTQEWKNEPNLLKKNALKLSNKKDLIEKKIQTLKKDLGKKAEDIQKQENDLKSVQKRVKESQKSLAEQKTRLEEEKSNIASLVVSLVKMGSVPLDTLILLPQDKSKELIISYHALQSIHPELRNRVQVLEKELSLLEQKNISLRKETLKKKNITEELRKKREDISTLISERQEEHLRTSHAHKEAQARAVEASKTARDLKELIQAVKKKNKPLLNPIPRLSSQKEKNKEYAQGRDMQTKKDVKHIDIPSSRSFRASKTKRLPVRGDIITRYGQMDKIGAKSQGLTIRSVSGALVIAPKTGIVKYSGDFRKYGRIILLEHGKNYHSLIAGLDKIDTVVGQTVSEGEPIGSIQDNTNMKYSLYYELRLNGNPVNPLTHLSRL